jgi:hypothetical protein
MSRVGLALDFMLEGSDDAYFLCNTSGGVAGIRDGFECRWGNRGRCGGSRAHLAGLFRNYPELEPEDLGQALAFAAANLEDSATESNAA